MTSNIPRDDKGRFLPVICTDPNCGGVLMLDSSFGSPIWQCDGLTHDTDAGPLRPCERSYPASIGEGRVLHERYDGNGRLRANGGFCS